ncbi:MAG TPA: ABC transporter ATP-binding protein [Anaerolineae bacterium]|nr:ABC transporter ATP-binding protein [Anaerolineae bacterium]
MRTSKLSLHGVRKAYRVDGHIVHALDGVSLHAAPGEFVTIIGPSGCGKSTLFNLICGLEEPDEGEIRFDGRVVSRRIGQVGYMPQRDLLLPWRSVLDNVILGPELARVPREHARQRARALLPLFGLEGFADAYPTTLSGGMRQRAALLRTFLCERDILLLDEPFGALDALTRAEMQAWLLRVWQAQAGRQTILFVTHDVEEAVFLSDRVYVLTPRPARVRTVLTIDLPRPRDRHMVTSLEFTRLKERLLSALEVKSNE